MNLELTSASIDAAELQAELVAAGFDVTVVVNRPASHSFSVEPPSERIAADDFSRMMDIVRAHRPSVGRDLEGLVTKARAVWRGEDSFTQAQAQKILAGLVLVVARHLR